MSMLFNFFFLKTLLLHIFTVLVGDQLIWKCKNVLLVDDVFNVLFCTQLLNLNNIIRVAIRRLINYINFVSYMIYMTY